jgi:hypothetical protein
MSGAFVLTPHKLALMFIAYQYALETVDSRDATQTKSQLGTWLERALSGAGTAAIAQWNGREPTLSELVQSMQQSLVREWRSIAGALHAQLNRVDSPDALFDAMRAHNAAFFAERDGFVYTGSSGLALVSLCGVYQRAVSVAFVRLSFEGMCTLFGDLRSYLNQCSIDEFDSVASPSHDDADVVDDDDDDSTWLHVRSRLECEAIASAELAAIESGLGAVAANDVERRLARLRRRVPAFGKLFFLRYVSALLSRRFDDALDALHSYFDASVYYYRKSPAALREAAAAGSAAAASEASEEKVRRGAMFAYAALALTRLHYAAGNVDAAREALDEATRVAQERVHWPSLANTLWWSARLQRVEHGRVAARRTLLRSFGAARGSDEVVATVADLELAESYCEAPAPVVPPTPWTPPAARETLETSGSATVAVTTVARHLFRASLQASTRGAGEHHAATSMVRASVWKAHGREQLALVYARLALRQTLVDTPPVSPLTLTAARTSPYREWTQFTAAAPRATTVDAALRATLVLMRKSADDGQAVSAAAYRTAALHIAATQHDTVPQTELQASVVAASRALESESAARNGEVERARAIAHASLGASRQDIREQLAARNRLANCDVAAGRAERAYTACVELQAVCDERGLELDSLAHTLTACDALLLAGDVLNAQRCALRCEAIATRLGAAEPLCKARLRLARTLVYMGQPQRARQLVDALRVLAARCSSHALLAEIELVRVRALITDGATFGKTTSVTPLRKALATFELIGDIEKQRECCALLATVSDRCGFLDQRNKFAKQARALAMKRDRQQQ